MNLKRINQQIQELANRLPLRLCQTSPDKLTASDIILLQNGIHASANLTEQTNTVIKLLAEEVQVLRNEIAELKGEQGKPIIRPQFKSESKDDDKDDGTPSGAQLNKNKNISSEKERKNGDNKPKKKKRTNAKINITRTVTVTLNKDSLPADLVFKGYQPYIVQDIKFEADNIEFRREVYYSPSSGQSYTAPLPVGYNSDGGYGNTLKALVINLQHGFKMSQPDIHKLLNHSGVLIAPSTISRLLTDNHEVFHNEKDDMVLAGLMTSIYAHLDDTSGRVNGQNQYVHILCSEYFVAYFTREHKNRMTILEILGQGIVSHCFDEKTFELLQIMGVSEKLINQLSPHLPGQATTSEVTALLNELLPVGYVTAKKNIVEASAIIAYRQLPHALWILVCDEAPQFKGITEILAACWVHAGRHYKKLAPIVPEHKHILNDFITKLWSFYHKLRQFQEAPIEEHKLSLSLEFDALFSTVTGYHELDERIAKTKKSKENLLVVLEYPTIPLHNNPAELGARAQARKRDVSFQTINARGTKSKDTFMSIIATARQLGVNTFDYIKDRVSGAMKMPSLAEIINNRAKQSIDLADLELYTSSLGINTT